MAESPEERRKRGSERQMTKEEVGNDDDEESCPEPASGFPKADEATLKGRKILKARRTTSKILAEPVAVEALNPTIPTIVGGQMVFPTFNAAPAPVAAPVAASPAKENGENGAKVPEEKSEAKPSAEAVKSPEPAKPAAAGGFVWPPPASDGKATGFVWPPPAASTPAVATGSPAPAASPAPAFTFGAATTAGSAPAPFQWPALSTDAKAEAPKPFAFPSVPFAAAAPFPATAFSASVPAGGGFSFAFPPPAPAPAASSNAAGDDDDVAEENPAAMVFRKEDAIVELAEVETKTGEEDEVKVLEVRGKLFRFVDAKWVEKGLGHLRLNTTKESGKISAARFVMRGDGALGVVLNSALFEKMVCEKVGDKSVRFMAVESDGKPCLHLLRVQNPKEADTLVENVLDILKILPKPE